MIRLHVTALFLALVAAACGAPQPSGPPPAEAGAFEGQWRGTLEIAGQSLRLELVLETGEGGVSGALYSVDQGGARMDLTRLEIEGDAIAFAANPPGLSYEGVLTGDVIEGRFSQNLLSMDLDFERGLFEDEAAAPEAAGADERAITVEAGAASLAGVLRLPQGEGPFPGVVILSGSGPQDRDGTIAGQPVYAALAGGLAAAGIASLRLDDRGVGESTGPAPQSPADLAADAAAALAALRAEPDISCAGFAGHSEGALIALLAAGDAAPAFIVSLAGMHVSMEETLVGQAEAMARAAGADDVQIDANRALQEAVFDVYREAEPGADLRATLEAALLEAGAPPALAAQQAAIWGLPYAAAAFAVDPGAAAAAYDGPLLAVFAANDLQVLLEPNRAALERDRDGPPTEIAVIEGVNHLFQESETRSPSEYGAAGHAMAPQALDEIGALTARLAAETCTAR